MVLFLEGERLSSIGDDEEVFRRVCEFIKVKLTSDWIEPLHEHLRTQRRVNTTHEGLQHRWEGVGKEKSLFTDGVKVGKKIMMDTLPEYFVTTKTLVEY